MLYVLKSTQYAEIIDPKTKVIEGLFTRKDFKFIF
jgi:hypothetical protein